ncbi:hypothetical protein [Nonomuraea typhae]|uniref:Uncharacterized protein n=1 Tax=Nonomuraea typhae TaxID=2603600 RepID=A0ABW7YS21_9ACTN
MTESITPLTSAGQARVLLASAARPGNFRTDYDHRDAPYAVLQGKMAATATYQVQAATTHALLAVADELAALRAEVHKVAGLGAAVVDVAEAVQDQSATIAQVGAEAAAQVVDLRDVFDAGLAGVDDTLRDVAAEVAELAGELVEHRVESYARPLGWLARWRERRRARAEFDAMIDAAGSANQLHDTLIRAAEVLDCQGWNAWNVSHPDVVHAVEAAAREWPRSAHRAQLCTQAWYFIVAHLGQPLTEWQRESGRTRAEVVAMLRQVAATVTGDGQDSVGPELAGEAAGERVS